ncbi:MAG TPA: hypothetical protein VHL80_04215, partial [Polyangia bacterium]|nr:hypothetical protein [Polyangia bacterium]
GAGGRDAGPVDASRWTPDDVAADAGAREAAPDAGEAEAAPPRACAPMAVEAPEAQVTLLADGSSIDEEAFLGGELASGTYVLSQVVHFGASYAGPTRELWIVDADAETLEIASRVGDAASDARFALAKASPTVLTGFPSCGAAAPSNWNYLVTDAGGTLSVNQRGSDDILLLTKQAGSAGQVVGP